MKDVLGIGRETIVHPPLRSFESFPSPISLETRPIRCRFLKLNPRQRTVCPFPRSFESWLQFFPLGIPRFAVLQTADSKLRTIPADTTPLGSSSIPQFSKRTSSSRSPVQDSTPTFLEILPHLESGFRSTESFEDRHLSLVSRLCPFRARFACSSSSSSLSNSRRGGPLRSANYKSAF